MEFNFKFQSQFNHSVVEITPGDHNTNCVKLLTKPALAEFVSWDSNDFPRLVSDSSLPLLGRQLAIYANVRNFKLFVFEICAMF